MIIKKKDVDINALGDDLKNLMATNIKKDVVIGKHVYEIYPMSALELFDVLSEIFEIVEQAKFIKMQELKMLGKSVDEKNVQITINDVIKYPETRKKVKELLLKILKGVDEEDLNSMTVAQMGYLIASLIDVNLKTLPKEIYDEITRQARIVEPSQSSGKSSKGMQVN